MWHYVIERSDTSFLTPTIVVANMIPLEESNNADVQFRKRLARVCVSIVILTGVTVILGYGGWIVLTFTAKVSGYDPKTADGELLRDRLLEWPDRNREVMRSNGRTSLPLKP